MTCRDFPCDFRVEDTDDYSAYCLECGRRDPMADLILAGMERDAEIADAMAEWTVRDDGDFEFTDDGTFFHVRVLPPLVRGDVRRYGVYAKRSVGWDHVGMFRDMTAIMPAVWRFATQRRLTDMGITPSPVDPPF